jgi:hypothetical protein
MFLATAKKKKKLYGPQSHDCESPKFKTVHLSSKLKSRTTCQRVSGYENVQFRHSAFQKKKSDYTYYIEKPKNLDESKK